MKNGSQSEGKLFRRVQPKVIQTYKTASNPVEASMLMTRKKKRITLRNVAGFFFNHA